MFKRITASFMLIFSLFIAFGQDSRIQYCETYDCGIFKFSTQKTTTSDCNNAIKIIYNSSSDDTYAFSLFLQKDDGSWMSPGEGALAGGYYKDKEQSAIICDKLSGKIKVYYYNFRRYQADGVVLPSLDQINSQFGEKLTTSKKDPISSNNTATTLKKQSSQTNKKPSKSAVSASPGLYEVKDKPFKNPQSTQNPAPGKARKAKH